MRRQICLRIRRGLLIAAVVLLAGCAERKTGPWNLRELASPPRMEWVNASGPVRGLYYAGEPYRGKPTRVFAYCALPETRDKVPAMVLVHGGGGKAFREWAEIWGRRGYAAIAMDLAGCGPDGKRLPDGSPDQSHEEKFEAIRRGVREAWPWHAVANVIRAHSLLRTLPGVDPHRTGVTGISWGGYLTCIVAGLDDRFRAAAPVYGCGFLHENSAWLRMFERMTPPDRQAWIDNFDPSQYLPGCRVPTLFLNGTNDLAYPLDSYRKSYRLVRGPRTLCVTIRMPHSHPAGWAPQEIGIFMDSVLRGGAPLARIGRVRQDGRKVTAPFTAVVPVIRAELAYTTDSGSWRERQWHSLPATVSRNEVTAELPVTRGITWFLTLTDEREATVSSEHEEAGP